MLSMAVFVRTEFIYLLGNTWGWGALFCYFRILNQLELFMIFQIEVTLQFCRLNVRMSKSSLSNLPLLLKTLCHWALLIALYLKITENKMFFYLNVKIKFNLDIFIIKVIFLEFRKLKTYLRVLEERYFITSFQILQTDELCPLRLCVKIQLFSFLGEYNNKRDRCQWNIPLSLYCFVWGTRCLFYQYLCVYFPIFVSESQDLI